MITPIKLDDGKEYYVAYMAAWQYRALSLDPWPEIFRLARRQLARIGG